MQITLPPNCTPSLHDPPFSKLNPRDRNIDGKFNKRIEKEKWFHSIDIVSHENGRVEGTADSYVYLGGGGGGLSEWKLCGVACTRAAGRARRYATLLGST